MESANCRGVNPGAFHIILGNMIGINDEGFVADVTRDIEVWNQAIYGYESQIVQERYKNFSRGVDKRTVKEVKVDMVMYYTIEIASTWNKSNSKRSLKAIKYKYWLELDEFNNIIGGTWISHDRPDFLWKMNKPQFTGELSFIKNIYNTSTLENHDNNPRNEDIQDTNETRHHNIQIKSNKRKNTLFGEKIETKGKVKYNVKKLLIEYYDKNKNKIRSKSITIENNYTFEISSFFWKRDFLFYA